MMSPIKLPHHFFDPHLIRLDRLIQLFDQAGQFCPLFRDLLFAPYDRLDSIWVFIFDLVYLFLQNKVIESVANSGSKS